jgi:hypothetical protein
MSSFSLLKKKKKKFQVRNFTINFKNNSPFDLTKKQEKLTIKKIKK